MRTLQRRVTSLALSAALLIMLASPGAAARADGGCGHDHKR